MADKTKPIPVTARDLASEHDSVIGEDTENFNQRKQRPINEELKAIKQKWWLQGDQESIKKNMIAQKIKFRDEIERESYLKA